MDTDKAALVDSSSKDVEGHEMTISLPPVDIDQSEKQTCLGEPAEVERILDARCPCLHSKCLRISGSCFAFIATCSLLLLLCHQYLKEFLYWLENLPPATSALMFLIMFTMVAFPMTWGYIVLNVAAGYLYGFIFGLCTVILSVMFGVTISLVVCRKLIRNFVTSKLESEHLQAIIKVVESRRGFKVIILTRLTPIPFGLQNGLFAITNVSIPKCLFASILGLFPTQALNSYMGSTLRSVGDVMEEQSGGYILLLVQVIISLGLMYYVVKRARYELNKACLPEDGEWRRTMSSQQLHDPSDLESQELFISKLLAKPSHKRAQSASAIQIEKERQWDDGTETV